MWIGKVIINDTIEPTRKFLERAVLINKVSVSLEVDIANAVKETFVITGKMGFRRSIQFLVATSVSELARNIFQYGNGGVIFFGYELGQGVSTRLGTRARDIEAVQLPERLRVPRLALCVGDADAQPGAQTAGQTTIKCSDNFIRIRDDSHLKIEYPLVACIVNAIKM